jgi:hypothetical protein
MNRKSGRWHEMALIVALAGMLAAIGALGIGVLSTWGGTAAPGSQGIEGGRLQAQQGRPAEPVSPE